MRRRILAASLALGLALALAGTPALAEDAEPDPVGDLKKLLTPQGGVSTAVEPPDPPASDDDSPGNETTNPVSPDHASTRGIDLQIGGNPVLGTNHDNATINDDGSTNAHASPLILGGNELFASDASSTGDNSDSNGVINFCNPGDPVCLQLLYSSAEATDDGSTSYAEAQSGIANLCLNPPSDGGTPPLELAGDNATAAESSDVQSNIILPPQCALSVGAVRSFNAAQRDQSSGQTQAVSFFEGAEISGEGAGITALQSFGVADSGGPFPSAERGSSLLFFGEDTPFSDPQHLSIPMGCPAISLLCIFLNQGETYLGPGVAGTAQDAFLFTFLKGTPLEVFLGIGHTETLVHNEARDDDDDDDDDGDDDDGDDDEDDDRDKDGKDRALPDTGGPAAALLALGLFGVAAGSGFVAAGRRERDDR